MSHSPSTTPPATPAPGLGLLSAHRSQGLGDAVAGEGHDGDRAAQALDLLQGLRRFGGDSEKAVCFTGILDGAGF